MDCRIVVFRSLLTGSFFVTYDGTSIKESGYRYRPRRIAIVRKPEFFKTWLMRILINNCYAIYHKRSRIILNNQCLDGKEVQGDYEYVEIPDVVNSKIDMTLEQLEEPKKSGKFSRIKIASAVAVFVVVCGVFCVVNPAMAAKVPVLGYVFQMVQHKVSYSGDYRGEKLEKETKDSILTTKDQGIRLTASEVYSDGFSVFVTMQMECDDYDFSKIKPIPSIGGQSVCLATRYGINEQIGEEDQDIVLQGENDGTHTFVGMMKFDKENFSEINGYVNIAVETIYLDDPETSEGAGIQGNRKLKIPYTTDKEHGKEILVNKKLKDDFTVKKVFVSPYQLVILNDTREVDYEIGVYDQNGNRLRLEQAAHSDQGFNRDLYSIRGKRIEKVSIYVKIGGTGLELVEADETEAKEIADYDFTVDLQ